MCIVNKYQEIVKKKIELLEFTDIFSSEDDCIQLYFWIKHNGDVCKKCGRDMYSNYIRVSRKDKKGNSKKAFRCRSCRTYVYPLSNTIFRGSPVPVSTIFAIMFFTACTKGSHSAIYTESIIGLSYKTCHKLMMIVRGAMVCEKIPKFNGTVEVDEAFLGSGSKHYNWSGISTRKKPIIGMIERSTGNIRMFLAKDRKSATIKKLIHENIEEGSTIYTDSWVGYDGLSDKYTHESVNHSEREYVRGDVHTNGIEGAWGHLKRNIRKAHVKISDKYVQEYINEACWKKNFSNLKSMELFDKIIRLTFTNQNQH